MALIGLIFGIVAFARSKVRRGMSMIGIVLNLLAVVSLIPLILTFAPAAGWSISVVDSSGGGYNSSIAIDASGNPHISYQGDGSLKYARYTGSTWIIQTVDSAEYVGDTSLALDAAGNPHISYWGNYNLNYARWTGSAWLIQAVVPGGWNSSIALDASGNPHISYQGDGSLKYARWTGSKWIIQTIDLTNVSNIEKNASIALDASGDPYISYFDEGDNALKYAVGPGRKD